MTTHSHARAITTQVPAFSGIFRRLALAHAAWRQRRALAELDDAALRDLGLTRGQALAEAQRPVWDVPQHWIK